MTGLLSISLALVLALAMTRLAKPLKLPAVTAYLVTGVLIGPYGLGLLGIPGVGFQSFDQLDALEPICNVALGFIAFTIGNEFRLSQLRRTGKPAMVIGIVQGVTAAAFVDIALAVLHFLMPQILSISAAITLGAIATATAPAATLMVVRQYKAEGELTDLLLPIVALDDAVGLVVFAVSFGVARAIQSGTIELLPIVLEPLLEIVLSLLLGSFLGWLLTVMERHFNSNSNRLSLVIGFVVLTAALSMVEFEVGSVHIGFSSLLTCMMMGTIFCNLCLLSGDLMDRCDGWTAPLFALFFVLSGAELELGVFKDLAIVGVGVVFILFRSLGKYLGSFASAKAVGCDSSICKYLGITLLPQAGVALGMCVTAKTLGPVDGPLIRNIVLFSVLVYELVGPTLTKMALTAAGDIGPKSDEAVNRRQRKIRHALITKD